MYALPTNRHATRRRPSFLGALLNRLRRIRSYRTGRHRASLPPDVARREGMPPAVSQLDAAWMLVRLR